MLKSIKDAKNLKGKTVLLRSDLDAPREGNRILDDFRIRMASETIEYLRQKGSKVIIVSKEGRPEGFDPKLSLYPVGERLAEILNKKLVVHADRFPDYDIHHTVFYPHDLKEKGRIEALKQAPARDIILLENIRFYKEEETDNAAFAKKLASIADIYVDDAFAMAHRDELSITMLPRYLPSYMGLNFAREITALEKVMTLNKKPFTLIIGGAKVSDKVGVIRNLGKTADHILVGGGPANLFFLAKGYEIGKSIVEADKVNLAKDLMRNYKDKIVLPAEVVVAKASDHGGIRVCKPTDIKKTEAIFDIGPATILEFSSYIKPAKKLVWNGPMGQFEKKPFSHGTMAIAEIFASRCKGKAFGVTGGGDTAEAIKKAKVAQFVDFVSTAGGAMLNYLAGTHLPAIKALEASAEKYRT